MHDVSDCGITTDDMIDAAYGSGLGLPGDAQDPIPDYTNDAVVNSL